MCAKMTDVTAQEPRKAAFTTLYLPRRRAWVERLDMVDPTTVSTRALFRQLLRAGRDYRALVLNGSGSPLPELGAAAVIGRRSRPPEVIVADCVWGSGGSGVDRLASKAGIRLMDNDHVHYCVHSAQQKKRFPELWGIAAERVHVAPYYYTLSEEELAEPVDRSGGVFAGGDSHRDYGPLIEAAREVDSDFTLATGRLSGDQLAALPPNVRAGSVPHDEFMRLFRSAAVVVVALQGRSDRSAGEQTYLNAMVLGKPVIVVDTMGVREYIEDGKTGLIVPPRDAAAMAAAVRWVMDPANEGEIARMTERARELALSRYGPDDYVAGLLAVLDHVLA
jgi:glycosyltransferase involved in cell wall biosynthesis